MPGTGPSTVELISGALAPPVPVGRGAEIARLHETFDRVRRGHAARVLLTGESGVGTSTLADAFCAHLAAEPDGGPVVVRVTAPEPVAGSSDVAQAYATTVRLAHALDVVAGPARATSARSAAGLHDTVVRARQGPTGPRPVVVVLHDLHHADPASAGVLTDLLARLRTGGLLLLATATDPARLPTGTRAWWPWLFAGTDPTPGTVAGEARTVVVGGLDAPAVAALVASRRPAAPLPGPGVAEQLVAVTGGHPVHLALLVRGLSDEALAGVAPPAPWRSLATEVGLAAAELRPVPRRLLGALSTLGDPSPVPLIEQVAGLDADEVSDADVEDLVGSGLVTAERDGVGWVLAVVHRLVRSAVLRAIPPDHRGTMHCAAAVAVGGRAGLAHAVAGAAGRPYPALADALEESAAAETSDHDEAATRLLWAAEVSPNGAEREARLLAAAVRLVRAGALTRLRAMEPWLRGAHPRAERDLALGVLLSEASDPEAHLRLQAAAEDPGADPRVAALAAVYLGTDHALHGRGARAAEAVARAVDLTEEPRRREQMRVVAAVGRAQQWGPDAGLELLSDHLPSAYGPDPAVIAGRLHLAAGRTVEGYRLLHEGLDRVRTGALTTTGRLVHLYLAEAAFRTGRLDEAEAEARVGASTSREVGSAWIGPASRAMWAGVLAVRGEGVEAEAHLRRAHADLEHSPHSLGLAMVRISEALVAHERGDHEHAHRLLRAIADGPVPPLLASPTAPWRVLRAEVALDAGHPMVATEEIDDWPVFGAPLWFTLSRHRLLGRLAERSGDAGAAWDAYRTALDLADAEPIGADACPAEIAALHASAGILARARGWPSAAADLATARRAYAALGAQPWVARIDAEIDAGVPDDAPAPDGLVGAPAVPDTLPAASASAPPVWTAEHPALTPREREVVRLVAQGLTSREVAAALYVTPKAISYHLGNVFAKLGVTSRRQLWGRTF
ncbi:helix-turn-helix transcriptional regulator [Actinomycetospora sp.]|uniref:helix-turn-helix transcriptional regulator n=1 Tax=Actinomycetospora sp. TaxID=1872135 RepID=UPI002F4088CF